MAQAYDFALEKVGLDPLSHQIYTEYITFLKNVPAVGSYAENQKITAVRKIYQRAIVTPLHNIETIWNEYSAYEKSVNPQLAEKLITDRSKDYYNARKVAKNMEAVTRGINRNMISVPPRGTATELKQVDLWKKYLKWEKSNPLATEDTALVARRVVYAYEQALLCLGYYPDMWYEGALYMQEASKLLAEKGDAKASRQLQDEIATLYDRATNTILKDNMLLYFAYADFEEERMNYDKVKLIYNNFLQQPQIDPTLAYIQFMKFARRTEGIQAARAVFKRVREDSRCKCQGYVAAALMEYYCTKDPNIAFKIFELGLKKYSDRPEYALAYIDYLSHLNEDNNTRVLFERILTSGNLQPEKSLDVWDKYLEFESHVGDLASIAKVDKRRREALQKEFASFQTLLLVDRYKFMDLYPCSSEEMRLLGYSKALEKFSPYSSAMFAGTNPAADKLTSTHASHKQDPHGMPVPDCSQMIPFKPRIITTSSYHPVPGGVFPPPPAVAHLMTLIPPPVFFHGPFVGVDLLLDKFREMSLPDDFPNAPTGIADPPGTPLDPKLAAVKREFYSVLAETVDPLTVLQQDSNSRKRPANSGDSDDENHMDGSMPPPPQDIYRLRQQFKRVK